MDKNIKRYFFLSIGFITATLGIIGLFLPLMPTTCFLIVAVWAFSKSNQDIARKILNHPQFGPAISNWMRDKSINRQTKCTINLSIVVGFSITLLLSTPPLLISAFLISGMLMLLFYINTRSENYPGNNTEPLETGVLSSE